MKVIRLLLAEMNANIESLDNVVACRALAQVLHDMGSDSLLVERLLANATIQQLVDEYPAITK